MMFPIVNPSLKNFDEGSLGNLVHHLLRIDYLITHFYLDLLGYESFKGLILLILHRHRTGYKVSYDTCLYVVETKTPTVR